MNDKSALSIEQASKELSEARLVWQNQAAMNVHGIYGEELERIQGDFAKAKKRLNDAYIAYDIAVYGAGGPHPSMVATVMGGLGGNTPVPVTSLKDILFF